VFQTQILPLVASKGHYGKSWLERRPIYILERISSKASRVSNILSVLFSEKLKGDKAWHMVREELLDICVYSMMHLYRMGEEMDNGGWGLEVQEFDKFLIGEKIEEEPFDE